MPESILPNPSAQGSRAPEVLLARIEKLEQQIEANERDREIQNAVHRIADITTSAEDMGEFYASLHEIVKELTSTDAFFIAIYHEDEGCISYPYYEDQYDDEQEQDSMPLRNRSLIPVEQLSHSLTWKVISNNDVLRVVDVANSGNAKDALTAGRSDNRKLTVRAGLCEQQLRIDIQDNGCGIPRDDLTKIFSHRFTIKNSGHGFGLHSCANTIGEMGGKITVESDGPGKGATFTIAIPFIDASTYQQESETNS